MLLSEATVTIVGLGLMGGSLALALRGKCAMVLGVARRPELAELAVKTGVVDAAYCDLRSAAAQADLVVLATPLLHILSSIPEAAAFMRPGSLLMDLGSAKAQVVEAMNAIPVAIAAVGGHPMCGKEIGGLESADPSLFCGATFVLTPTKRTTGAALSLAHELVAATGARPLALRAEQHDRAAAVVSHLPYLLAASLVHAEKEANSHDPAVGMLAASGFRDTTRLAASQVDMILDTLLANRMPVEAALTLFDEKLAQVRSLLDSPDALRGFLTDAQRQRRGMFT
ncbi:MAG: prephenate dehydrogenase/arogenate dehydrogenase family protein [Chloroflexi bacterium]|nr:prephenate dehydrogenase/arogenate dehydrogenase family protein [Chloroflexota bacterium]